MSTSEKTTFSASTTTTAGWADAGRIIGGGPWRQTRKTSAQNIVLGDLLHHRSDGGVRPYPRPLLANAYGCGSERSRAKLRPSTIRPARKPRPRCGRALFQVPENLAPRQGEGARFGADLSTRPGRRQPCGPSCQAGPRRRP